MKQVETPVDTINVRRSKRRKTTRVRLTLGANIYVMSPDEAMRLADQLVDVAERIHQ